MRKISSLLVILTLLFSTPLSSLAEEGLGHASSTTKIQEENNPENLFEFEVQTASSTPEENIENIGSSTEETGTSTPPLETGSSTPDETATTTEAYLNIEADITLPNGCEVLDSSGENHIFPQESSPSEYLAICALMKALEEGVVEEVGLSNNPSFGLFVESINDIQEEEHFWALWHNGGFAGCGIGCLELQENDTVAFVLTSFGGEETHRVTIHIESLLETFNNVTVPDTCSITAASSTDPTATSTHFFPHDSSPSDFLGVCALVRAKEKGFVNEFEFIDFGWGLWLDSVNEIKTAEDWSAFWALSINWEEAPVGIADLAVEPGDTITLSYEDEHVVEFRITALFETEEEIQDPEEETGTSTPPSTGSGGSGSENTQHNKLEIEKALEFLESKQKSDGSFGADLYTDWVAIAVAAAEGMDPGIAGSLKAYLKEDTPSLTSLTDYERRAMALMAMGISPYDDTGINYIEKIVESFDGNQIGDPGLVNDDIFALFPLLKAGYSQNDDIVKESVSFILSRQSSNGRWESPDLTGAAVQALSIVRGLPGARSAIDDATDYLRSIQEDNGGFDTDFGSSGTSWIMQALISAGESIEEWKKEGKNPHNYLYSVQEDDGGVEDASRNTNDRVWATAYAIPAALEIPWEEILENFSRPKASQTGNTAEENDEEENDETPAEEEELIEEVLGVSTSTRDAEEGQEPPEVSIVLNDTSAYSPTSANNRLAHDTREPEEPESESEKGDQVEILEEKEESTEPQDQGGVQTETKLVIIMGMLLALGIAFKLFKP